MPQASPSKHPAVAETRRAVRRLLQAHLAAGDLDPGGLVFAAVSGGADSLALAAALAWVGPKLRLEAGALTVDHGLQAGSAERAELVVQQCRRLGLSPVFSISANVVDAAGDGPEAAARQVRYDALWGVAEREGASAVLTAHTLDDQAESVLLGLARGSGARSLSGMAPSSVRSGRLLLRPFLEARRATTVAACQAIGLEPWQDPHNADPSYARVRARHDVLPALEGALGPGIAQALARSADLLRDDADLLDQIAATYDDEAHDVATLAGLHPAVRRRVLRRAALAAGAPAGALSAEHVVAIDRLVVDWHGQDGVSLPGGLVAERRYDRLSFR